MKKLLMIHLKCWGKWFPHLAYNNIAANVDGEILINNKK